MTDSPFAYMIWMCSQCDVEAVPIHQPGADLVCETCGSTYVIRGGHHAVFVSNDEER